MKHILLVYILDDFFSARTAMNQLKISCRVFSINVVHLNDIGYFTEKIWERERIEGVGEWWKVPTFDKTDNEIIKWTRELWTKNSDESETLSDSSEILYSLSSSIHFWFSIHISLNYQKIEKTGDIPTWKKLLATPKSLLYTIPIIFTLSSCG